MPHSTGNGPFHIVGWGRVEATAEIGVAVTLQYRVSGDGTVVSSTSLLPQAPTNSFSIPAVISRGSGTGMALLNPSETEPAEVVVQLFRTDGRSFGSRTIRLAPRGKIVQFFDEGELFTNLSEFLGSADILEYSTPGCRCNSRRRPPVERVPDLWRSHQGIDTPHCDRAAVTPAAGTTRPTGQSAPPHLSPAERAEGVTFMCHNGSA